MTKAKDYMPVPLMFGLVIFKWCRGNHTLEFCTVPMTSLWVIARGTKKEMLAARAKLGRGLAGMGQRERLTQDALNMCREVLGPHDDHETEAGVLDFYAQLFGEASVAPLRRGPASHPVTTEGA